MAEPIGNRLQHAWNAFMGRDPTRQYADVGVSSYYRQDKRFYNSTNYRQVVTNIYNRISLDVASINIEHVRLDDDRNYAETINSGINYCFTTAANIDQTATPFKQDIVMSMFDEGVVAVVPIDTTLNPNVTGAYDIETMRTGKIIEWYPKHVKVNVYNEKTGKHEDRIFQKEVVAIIENPFYAVMNEQNSTVKRLLRLISQIDRFNEENSSGKMDLIIQLPHPVKSETRRIQAEGRRKQIEAQLVGSKYGIAYIDSTEKITQLNRAVENNLWTQYTDLMSMLYNQLGLTQAIFDGTADEQTMLNYYNTTINPILTVITEEVSRKFLTKTARTRHQAIWYFRDPFELVPVEKLADIADKFTRNEILTSNEVRAIIGKKPSNDPRADELRNKNIAASKDQLPEEMAYDEEMMEEPEVAEEQEDDFMSQIREAVEGT